MKRGYEQLLAQPPRAAQEDILAEVYHVPDILSLVYVKTVEVYHLGECLYARLFMVIADYEYFFCRQCPAIDSNGQQYFFSRQCRCH